jgi:SAM-dependent methyltransferase
MRNAERWTESKYVWRGARLAGSRDRRELGVGSRLISDRVAALYQAKLPLYARGRLVDLGCGKAPLYGLYRRHSSAVTCVDWAASAHASPYVDQEADLNAALPFAPGSFDTIVLSDVLEHVRAASRLWAEMARILEPGGHLILNVPFLYGIHEDPHDYARYTEFALRAFADEAGFDVRELHPVGGSIAVMADLLAKHLAHLPLAGALLASAVQGLASLAERLPPGRALARATARRFPLGYFMVAVRREEGPAPQAGQAPS